MSVTAANGTRIIAPATARVVKVGWENGYGLMVVLDHGYGISTRYGHLSAFAVAPGQDPIPPVERALRELAKTSEPPAAKRSDAPWYLVGAGAAVLASLAAAARSIPIAAGKSSTGISAESFRRPRSTSKWNNVCPAANRE